MNRLHSIRARGLVPFPGEVAVDFDALPKGILAIVGPNGAGKSTFVNLAMAAQTRATVYPKGSLLGLARTRASEVEVRMTTSKPWRLVHKMDAEAGTSEGYAYGADGEVVVGPSVKKFEAWAAETLPEVSVQQASIFTAQKAGGFLTMTNGDRKALILRALGVEQLEQLAKLARGHAATAKAALDTVTARLHDEKRRAGFADGQEASGAMLVRGAELEVEQAQIALHIATGESQDADERLKAARAEAERIALDNASGDAARAEARSAREALDAVERRVAALDERVAGLRTGVLAQADAIRAADAAFATLQAEYAPVREQYAAAKEAARGADERHRSAVDADRRAGQALEQAEARARQAATRRAERSAALEDAAKIPEAEGALTAARAELAKAEGERDRLLELGRAGADGRIAALRKEHLRIEGAEDLSTARALATCAIVDDNDKKAALDSLPTDDAAARAAVASATYAVQLARDALAHLQARKAVAEAAADDEDHDAVIAAAKAAFAETGAARNMADEARTASTEAEIAVGRRSLELTKAIEAQSLVAGRIRELETAETTLGALLEQRQGAAAEQSAAAMRVREAEGTRAPPACALPDILGLEAQARSHAERVVERRARVADAQRGVNRAEGVAVQLDELATAKAQAEEDLADWTRLGQDLGINGLQAYEVDSIGPSLTEITNDLLHTCIGSRYTVMIETQRSNADGDRDVEGCFVRVIDNGTDAITAAEKNGELLSGGQQTIVGEAISLALAVVACARWETAAGGCTLIRDESGAALYPGTGPQYLAMLRRACAAIGVHQCLLVTHSEEIAALCDARIHIEDGRITVEHAA